MELQIVRGVDDADAPASLARRRAEEADGAAHVVDRDHGAQVSGLVRHALEHEQVAVGPGSDPSCHGVRGIDGKRFSSTHCGRRRIGMAQHESRDPVGESRLADAFQSADQPGMVDAPAAVGVEQGQLGVAMAEPGGGLARMGRLCRFALVGLRAAHVPRSSSSSGASAGCRRLFTTDQIALETTALSTDASIKMQRWFSRPASSR